MLKHAAYPTLAEGVRFLAAALDLRVRADPTARQRMDRAALSGDFDLDLFDELVEKVLHDPLKAIEDLAFAYEVAGLMRQWRNEYIRIVGRVSSDALKREELLSLLIEYFLTGWVADFLNHLEHQGLIRSAWHMAGAGRGLGGDPHPQPLGMVIQTFLWDHGAATHDPPGAFYPQPDDGDRDRRAEQVGRWISGAQCPSLVSIRSLVAAARAQPWFRGVRPQEALVTFQRELLIARALQHAAAEAAPYCDLLALIRDQLANRRLYDIGMLISRAVHKRGNPMGLSLIGLQTSYALDFSSSKSESDLENAEGLLRQFRSEAQDLAAPWAVEWMVTWCEARLAAWRRDFKASLALYEEAFAASVYRSGREARQILIEALALACLLRKRPHMKRLIHQGNALNILPGILGDVAPDADDGHAIAGLLIKCYAPHFPRPPDRPPNKAAT